MTRTPSRSARPARRRSSLALALGLVALSVFGGAGSAAAAPTNYPDITAIDALYPDNAPPSFTVTTPDPDTTVYVDWYARSSGSDVLSYCTAQTFSGTSATCTGAVSLTPGVYDVMAYSEVGSDPGVFSPYSPAISVEVYGVQAGALLSGPVASSSDATPTFTGTGPARGTVDVRSNANILCTTTVLNDNTWSCTTAPLAQGTYTSVNIRATDRSSAVTYDTQPDFTVTQIFDSQITGVDYSTAPWITGNTGPDLSGAKDPNGATIIVQVGPTATGPWLSYCTLSAATGPATWGCSEPDNGLEPGVNYLQLTTLNDNGDPSPTTQTYQVTLVAVPEIGTPADGSFTNDPTPFFSGTAEGTSVQVRDASSNPVCTSTITAGGWSCTSTTPYSDGTYKFSVTATPGSSVTSFDSVLTIDTVAPVAPAITSGDLTSTERAPTISGTGEPNATIQLRVNGSPWSCVGGQPVVDTNGDWSCTLANSLGVSSYPVTVRQTDRAGNVSSPSAAITVTVLPGAVTATPGPTPTPTPTPTPLTWRLGGGIPSEVNPGDAVTLTAAGLPPGLTVDAEFHSTPVALGSTVVRGDGSFSMPVTVPMDATPGAHNFVVTVWTAAGEAVVVEQPVTVVAFPKVAPDREAQDSSSEGGAGGEVDRSDPAAPSSFTSGITGVAGILANPAVLGVAAVAGVALFLLIAFPAELLNSTLSEQYSRFSRRVPKAPWIGRLSDWLERTPIIGAVVITAVAAVIFGFADPDFGFDITSFRVVLASAIGLFIVGYLASVISGRILRGRWKLDTMMELKPLGLILTVVGVVLSRLLEFSPGFLLGLVLGISLAGSTTVGQRAKATLVQAGVVFGLAMFGWLLYSALSVTVTPDTFGTALLFDTLVAMTSEGLTGVLIGLLPFKYLDGPSVLEYSKPLWIVSFLVAAFAFVAIIVPSAWGELTGSFWAWIAIVIAFAVVAVGIYLYFRFWAPPLPDDESVEESELVGSPRP